MTDQSQTAQEPRDTGTIASRRRDKTTKASVVLGEHAARWIITVGGLMVIVAVIGIMVFLVSVAAPLAGSGKAGAERSYVVTPATASAWLNADEYRTAGIRVAADGTMNMFHIDSGKTVATDDLGFEATATMTSVGGTLRRDQVAFGFSDGTVRFAEVGFDIAVVTPNDVPQGAAPIGENDRVADGAVYSQVAGNQFRRIALQASAAPAQKVSDEAIVAIDYRIGGTAERPTRSFVTVDAKGVTRLSRTEIKRNLLTGEETETLQTADLPPMPAGTVVSAVVMTSKADQVIVAGAGGKLFRFDTRNFNAPVLVETRQVFDEGVTVTDMEYLNGEQALVAGGSNGAVDVFFTLQPPDAGTSDGYALVRARSHEPHSAAVVGVATSQRNKTLMTLDADGNVWMRHSTSDQVLARYKRTSTPDDVPAMMLLPRVDAMLVVDDSGRVDYWEYKDEHPETTLQTIFGDVWYEGYSEPTQTWQSSSGTDVFEPKFSLIPLIFGTLKATFYSLLFAIPVALMGAIYTSEFLHRKVRASIKPVVEMMESLPTVVLGFVAALILAPIVETWIGAVLLAFVALPLGLMLSAFGWQMLPPELAMKLEGIPKFLLMVAAVALSGYTAYLLGPSFEYVFFNGDFKAWTNGAEGGSTAFMTLLLLPLAYIAVRWVFNRTLNERYRMHLRSLARQQAGVVEFFRWSGMLGAAVLVAWAVSSILGAVGFDPRGGVVDSYVQRNALVVGLVMGFAIIPNIYTLAEDALNSVPPHLRAASLAAGATPWQTAIWVILPTAMSGVFAACMIGMGRAVGETMIVVMAAGNTPIMDWNVFSGLRTLSANIAVELPEAVQDGTLYRMLFTAALTLFIMTFCINTVAEAIRMRFRKRAFQL